MTAAALDVSQLPAPTIVHPYDWEGEIAAFRADLIARLPGWRGVFESDSFSKVCQIWADRLTLKDAQHNRDARAMLLAYNTGADLDHVASTYFRTARPVIRPATATEPAVLMGDEEYRALAQLQPEATADFGLTPGGYVYKIRNEFGEAIKDVSTIRRGSGHMELRVLGRAGDGRVEDATIAAIIRAFAPEGASQSTDILAVFAAEIVAVPVTVTLLLPPGPDPAPVLAAARVRLEAFAAEKHRLGTTLWREAVQSAAHVAPTLTVRVEGMAEVIPGRPEAAPLLSIALIRPEIVR